MNKIIRLIQLFAPDSTVRKTLRLPFKALTKCFEVRLPILSGVLKGETWTLNSIDLSCWLGLFRSSLQDLLRITLEKGGVFYDCGAHVGYISLLAAKLVGPEGEVFTFEPLSLNLYFLKKYLRINRISNVHIIEAGVSDKCGN